jgi:hypothetical protein
VQAGYKGEEGMAWGCRDGWSEMRKIAAILSGCLLCLVADLSISLSVALICLMGSILEVLSSFRMLDAVCCRARKETDSRCLNLSVNAESREGSQPAYILNCMQANHSFCLASRNLFAVSPFHNPLG